MRTKTEEKKKHVMFDKHVNAKANLCGAFVTFALGQLTQLETQGELGEPERDKVRVHELPRPPKDLKIRSPRTL